MLLKDFIRSSARRLVEIYPEQEARSLVFLLSEHHFGVKSYTHIINPNYEVDGDALVKAEEAVDRLVSGEPLQYILGYASFCGYDFKVTPDVLIPRQETQLLCRLAIEEAGRRARVRSAFGKTAAPVRILDMCTGSGCIAWTLALSVKGVSVQGVDISEKALEVAQSQPFAKFVSEAGNKAPTFSKFDILDFEQECDLEPFDIIISNPPYIMEKEKISMEKNVLDHEPGLALFVPDDDPLRFYKAINRWTDKLLVKGGTVLMEINESLGKETAALFSRGVTDKVEIIDDLFGKNRIIKVTLSNA